MFKRHSFLPASFTLVLCCSISLVAETFRVATYNVENYLDQPTESRPFVKSAAAKAKVCESICALNPDVIALEEMGGTNALMELRASLKAKGQDFSHWEYVHGWDTNIHVAILSKLPIVARHPHTNDSFLLDGRRFSVSRGFAEVDIRAATNFTFTLIAAHLKSRRAVPEADEAQLRLEEARVLRGIVDEHFKTDPDAKLIVLGDFNDVKDSDSTKAIIGRGNYKLMDTRPAERNGDNAPNEIPRFEPRNITWTHYYGKEYQLNTVAWTYHNVQNDVYDRVDYILISPGMASHWLMDETYIPFVPNWGDGSDHRPILATFEPLAK
jgi:endonuclease/exonuclease/phosphatase family metal-dependent hydrolase